MELTNKNTKPGIKVDYATIPIMKQILQIGLTIAFGILMLFSSCRQEIKDEGFVEVEGGKIWYKVVGKGDGIPLLVMHGGPGGRSCGMIPGFSLLSNDRPVIFYDQLGSGNSDRPADTSLWKTERFVNEIDFLRSTLKLDELHILGHSCGSTFLIEYMVTKKPKGIKSVIFSSPMISTPDWIADAKLLLSQMPKSVQDTITKYEALKDYTTPSYQVATDSFYARHVVSKRWPAIADVCKNSGSSNDSIYNYMWGPTEFLATGTLSNFDRTTHLNKINEPILFIAGDHDEARPETILRYQKLSNNAVVEIIEGAAHSTYVDQPEQLAQAISKFLKSVENN
jgi:proline iminopeptidase